MPAVPYITPIDTPPSRADAANFSARTDNFLGELPTMQAQMNALGDFMNGRADAAQTAAATAVASPSTAASSTTSLTVGTGTRSPVIQAGKTLVQGMWVALIHLADPSIWMAGPAASYSGTALVVDVQRSAGSGTFTDWLIYAIQPMISDATPRNLANGSTIADTGGVARSIGFRGLPLETAKGAAYTLAPADAGMAIPTAFGVTVPANATVPIDIGELFAIINASGAAITLTQPTGVTLRLSGTATTGNRTIAQHSEAFLHKIGADEWLVSGAGVA